MLAQLTISNFAIVKELDIDVHAGMTTITGETGAGKSIAIDALGLCLGNRADASAVRTGAERADLCARFVLNDTPEALQWLQENQLDDQNECLLRRTVSPDGRSRSYINGTAVPLSQLRELGQKLIQIHGQHAHQQLLKSEHQLTLLDAYAAEPEARDAMRAAYQQWHHSRRELLLAQQQAAEREARSQLLQYQLKELNEFSPQPDEYSQIELEHRLLANGEQILTLSQQTLRLLGEEEEHNALSLIYAAQQQLAELVTLHDNLAPLAQMLEEASIQIHETCEELRHFAEDQNADPARLHDVEQRLSRYIALARKHQVSPETLHEHHVQLKAEYAALQQQESHCEELQQQVSQFHDLAVKTAQKLHQQREYTAKNLAQQITDSMQQLSMPHGVFSIQLHFDADHLSAHGASRVEFLVTTNPGQPLQPMAKVASGGELSRIALAIQVLTAQKVDTPALIFDEIDVGISGPTAAIVGDLLRKLGESTQVICVTHLPQVASKGHQHFFVSKYTDGNMTETQMSALDKKERLQEIARLLGGNEITRNTLANARELLAA